MTDAPSGRTPALSLFRIFLMLGCTSFGGPIAHLGYFREAFVARRGWFTEGAYADMVALAQFLPGPASSQVGMMIGLARGGIGGMLAAWAGFTLPSALALTLFAFGVVRFGGVLGGGWLLGLKAAAAAVVAQALIGMARTLAPDAPRAGLAVGGFVVVIGVTGLLGAPVWAQIAAILAGGVLGLVFLKGAGGGSEAGSGQEEPGLEGAGQGGDGLDIDIGRGVALGALFLFALLLIVPFLVGLDGGLGLADRFYRAGALVFGGGHVVLPLLQAGMVDGGIVGRDSFLAGYGAAQAVPGPLFTFASYLGAAAGGWGGAAIGTAAIFLPSMLLTLGALPFWARLRRAPAMRRALAGVNAAVVGLLAAAFYDPVLAGVFDRPHAVALAGVAFVALVIWKLPPWAVVVTAGVLGGLLL
ncbi:chromate efflux transporter [Marivibrio halodurans]|uniref:Chromate efflux transporter n=1 Tax=Marivibrio halodurans TaxID=2039722 RepID=A0A8J7V1H6_9PROT|nr:chromate efflux transporter [Marivibrio halodurans]MBP5855837.1 chromate efflux transporter [Marivibrio halodurans]